MKGQHTLNYTWTQLQTFLCPFIFAISKCFALITPLNSAQQLAALVCSSVHSLSPLAPARFCPVRSLGNLNWPFIDWTYSRTRLWLCPCLSADAVVLSLQHYVFAVCSHSLSPYPSPTCSCVCECLAQPSTNCDSIPFGAEQSPPVPAVHHWQHNCLAPVSPQQLERKSALLALSPHERPIQLASDLTRGRFSLSFFLFLHLCLYYFASFAVPCILFFVVCRKISSPLPVAVN